MLNHSASLWLCGTSDAGGNQVLRDYSIDQCERVCGSTMTSLRFRRKHWKPPVDEQQLRVGRSNAFRRH